MKTKSIQVALFTKPVTVSICIIKNIRNIQNVKTLIPLLSCSLVNAKLICSYDQLTSAITRTISNYLAKSMKTRSPYTELLYSLSPSTNVTESLMTFGVNEASTCAVAVRFSIENSEFTTTLEDDLIKHLSCTLLDFSLDSLVGECDMVSITEIYKPSTDQLIGEICTSIATKCI